MAMAATSCLRPATVDGFVVVDDGTVFARVYAESYTGEGGYVPTPRWARSQDGGSTWVSTPQEPPAPPSFAKEACSPNLGCFRLGNDRVEHSLQGSGSFAVSFTFSKEQRERIKKRSGGDCASQTDDGYRAIAIVSRSDGDHVVVAMGTQGALHRSPDGQWTRIAVLDRKPVPLHGPSWLGHLSLTPLAAAALSPVIFMVGWRRRSKARGVAALALAVASSVGLLSLAGGLRFFGVDYVVAGPLIAGLSVAVFIASIAYAQAGEPRVELPPGSASVS